MAIPKSDKLQSEEASKNRDVTPSHVTDAKVPEQLGEYGPVKIRPVRCCNDFVAIMQLKIETLLAMTDEDAAYKNEGLVVGVGPGSSDGNGGRLKPGVEIGELVVFGERNILQTIESSSPPYEGKRIIIVSEKNIICKLSKKVEYELVEE